MSVISFTNSELNAKVMTFKDEVKVGKYGLKLRMWLIRWDT